MNVEDTDDGVRFTAAADDYHQVSYTVPRAVIVSFATAVQDAHRASPPVDHASDSVKLSLVGRAQRTDAHVVCDACAHIDYPILRFSVQQLNGEMSVPVDLCNACQRALLDDVETFIESHPDDLLGDVL